MTNRWVYGPGATIEPSVVAAGVLVPTHSTYTCGSGGQVHLVYGSINGTKASAGLIAAPANTKDLTWSVPEVSFIIGDTYSATGPLSIDGRTAFTSSMNFGRYQLSSSFN